MRRIVTGLVGVAVLVLASGCRTAGRAFGGGEDASAGCGPTAAPARTVSRVLPGDTLHGRIACGTGCQCFYFEGLEYAFLDYSLEAEAGCQAAPTLSIEDPDGRPVDIGNGKSAKGIVLRRSGTYKGVVCGSGGAELVYAFQHDIRTSEPPERFVNLTPTSKEQVSFVAPRGSNCVVTVQPLHACGLYPKILAVYGPGGSRALDAEKQLQGAALPAVHETRGNTAKLQFNAAQPGRYTVVLASEEGTEGRARAAVQVFPPRASNRDLYHDNHPCPESTGRQVASAN